MIVLKPTKFIKALWWIAEVITPDLNVVAMASPKGVYVKSGYEGRTDILAHEAVHMKQMKEGGLLKFLIKYGYYQLKYGYWLNPYEVEAYKANPQAVPEKYR